MDSVQKLRNSGLIIVADNCLQKLFRLGGRG